MNRKKLEALVWKHTHRDFKGKDESGAKTILHNIPTVGTCLVKLNALSEEELLEELPKTIREQFKKENLL